MVLDSSSLNKISLLFEGFLAMIVMSYVLDFIIIIIILPRKSCTTQLVKYVDSVSQILNSSSRADIVFFDFMKAFHSVNHDIILSKLKYQYKIDGRLLKFLVNYLQGRSQRVVINESVSGNREVESGVPQGSIRGPLLFVLFINDMFSCVSSGTEIALYADDTKIWRKIESWDDHLALQEDIKLSSLMVYSEQDEISPPEVQSIESNP